MIADPTFRFAIQAAVGFVAGFAIGATHFVSLSWNTRLFATGSAGTAVALQLARIGLAVGALVSLALISPFA
ncbi:MAG: hypothetical protein JOY87_01355, partial [Candidatus Eremiobacteraeota bacterium]|nr:hypothetical protein [Candidatus Eremiobacteraeota bacterium]